MSTPFDQAGAAGELIDVRLLVNGTWHAAHVEARLLLTDLLRHELGLTGTHVGCEHGSCGACTVLLDGRAVRACLIFAVQANGCEVRTVEGLGTEDDPHPLQQALHEAHGVQCGFCTPGILMSMIEYLADEPRPDEAAVRRALAGNLCRCTGYQHIVDAVLLAAARMRGDDGGTA